MVRFCPFCHRTFPDSARVCPDHNIQLVAAGSSLEAGIWHAGQLVAGQRYQILAPLGQGSMGIVYRAWQLTMGREVAIKVLRLFSGPMSPEVAVARFFNEARAAASLHHPHTITVYDFGQCEDGSLFMTMELLNGRRLDQALKQDGRFPVHRAVAILNQVSDSLAEAHQQGLLHRDLKPANIMLINRDNNPDFVKVLDFGIAKPTHGKAPLTSDHEVLGTPCYMSPEQMQGWSLTPASDIYALGVILCELLTGRVPFEHASFFELARQVVRTPAPSLRQLAGQPFPDHLERLVARLLAKEPGGRPQTMAEFKRDLLAVLFPGAEDEPTIRVPVSRAELLIQQVELQRGRAAPPAPGPTPSTPVPDQEEPDEEPRSFAWHWYLLLGGALFTVLLLLILLLWFLPAPA